MKKEMPSDFYTGKGYLVKDRVKRYKVLYNEVVNLLPPDQNTPIIDLGCGPGLLSKTLYKAGYENYLGVDFSEYMIAYAKRKVPEFSFMIGSVYDSDIISMYEDYDIFILLEILEHIKNDTGVLESIPKNKEVILSLPNFMAKSHVRCFKNKNKIINRYEDLIDFKYTKILKLNRNKRENKIFLFKGTRK